jgi:hypothetical protein
VACILDGKTLFNVDALGGSVAHTADMGQARGRGVVRMMPLPDGRLVTTRPREAMMCSMDATPRPEPLPDLQGFDVVGALPDGRVVWGKESQLYWTLPGLGSPAAFGGEGEVEYSNSDRVPAACVLDNGLVALVQQPNFALVQVPPGTSIRLARSLGSSENIYQANAPAARRAKFRCSGGSYKTHGAVLPRTSYPIAYLRHVMALPDSAFSPSARQAHARSGGRTPC